MAHQKHLTRSQLRKALAEIPSIKAFAEKHDLGWRTMYRLLDPDGPQPRKSTMFLLEEALRKEGVIPRARVK